MKIRMLILFIIGMGFSTFLFSQKFLIRSMETNTKAGKNISVNEETANKISSVIGGNYVTATYNCGNKIFFLTFTSDIGYFINDTVWEIISRQSVRDGDGYSSSIVVVGEYVIATGYGGVVLIDLTTNKKIKFYEADRYNSFPLSIVEFSLEKIIVQNQETLAQFYIEISWPRKETPLNENIVSFKELENKEFNNFQVRNILGEIVSLEIINPWEKGVEKARFASTTFLLTSQKAYFIEGRQ